MEVNEFDPIRSNCFILLKIYDYDVKIKIMFFSGFSVASADGIDWDLQYFHLTICCYICRIAIFLSYH